MISHAMWFICVAGFTAAMSMFGSWVGRERRNQFEWAVIIAVIAMWGGIVLNRHEIRQMQSQEPDPQPAKE